MAILLMVMLGTAVFIGLAESAPNMRRAMDQPLRAFNRENIRITSPLGIYDEDKKIIESLEGVADHEYVFMGDFYLGEDKSTVIRLQSQTERLAKPNILEGRTAQAPNELVMDSYAREELGLSIGDKVTILPKTTKDEEKSEEKTEATKSEISTDIDRVELENPLEKDRLKEKEFTVVGFADHIYYLRTENRGKTNMGNGEVDFFALVQADSFDKKRPSMAILSMDRLAGMAIYSKDYRSQEQGLVTEIQEKFQHRPDEIEGKVVKDTEEAIEDGRRQVKDGWNKLADAEQEIVDGESSLEEGRREYEDGKDTYDREIADAEKKLADAESELTSAKSKLDSGETDYDDGVKEYNDSVSLLEDSYATLLASKTDLEEGDRLLAEGKARLEAEGINQSFIDSQESFLVQSQAEVDQGRTEMEAGYSQLPPNYRDLIDSGMAPADLVIAVEKLDATKAQLEAAQAEIDQGRILLEEAKSGLEEITLQEQTLNQGWAEYQAGRAEYEAGVKKANAGKEELDAARKELDQGWAEYYDGLQEYEDGLAELEENRASGQKALEDAQKELEDGEKELEDGKKELDEERPDAEKKLKDAESQIKDAESEIKDIRIPAYSVQGMYNEYLISTHFESCDNMDALTLIFPTVFYLVAMLTTLTTITRMIEEERTAIGTLKALGMSKAAVASKYLSYAVLSSLFGAVIGILFGFFVLMPVIFYAYTDGFDFILDPAFSPSLLSIGLAVFIGVGLSLLAAWMSVHRTLRQNAANLMRPKPPANGNRILVERIGWLWRKLSFIAKITLRNLTAKKSRMFMTLLGVFGSTTLIIMGFGLRASIQSLVNKQYSILQNYDVELVYNNKADKQEIDDLHAYIESKADLYTEFYQSQASFENAKGLMENFTLYVPKDIEVYRTMKPLRSRLSGKDLALTDERALISEQFARAIRYEKPYDLPVKDSNGFLYHVPIEAHSEQYVGHTMTLTPALYKDCFNEKAKPNAYIFQLREGEDLDRVMNDLAEMDLVQFSLSHEDSQDLVSGLINAMNIVVFIIIFISTLLAFVVLYNLTNLNVSERQRELSTIKVLGFQNKEVTQYVYRETIILTAIGILAGCIGGKSLHYMICMALSPSHALIDPALTPIAYLVGSVIVFAFSLLVMFIIHRQLKRVDMVEALKAAE